VRVADLNGRARHFWSVLRTLTSARRRFLSASRTLTSVRRRFLSASRTLTSVRRRFLSASRTLTSVRRRFLSAWRTLTSVRRRSFAPVNASVTTILPVCPLRFVRPLDLGGCVASLCPSSPDSSRTRRDFVGYRSETRKSGFNLTSRNTLHIWANRRLRGMLGVRLLRIWRLRRQQGPSHQASGSGFEDL